MTPLAIDPPKAGEMVALADDLYWMRFSLPFRLNHINLYAFDTKDGWLLLDCGIQSQAIAYHRLACEWPCQHHLPLIGNGLTLNTAIKKQPTIFSIKGVEIDMV